MSRFGLVSACCLAGLLLTGPTYAVAEDDLPPAVRVDAEHVFADGLQHHLPEILAHARTRQDRVPLDMLRRWWRREAPRDPTAEAPADPDTLAARRAAWARAGAYEPPYPVPGGGAVDPWPLLTALMQDRIHREAVGAPGLVEDLTPERIDQAGQPLFGPDGAPKLRPPYSHPLLAYLDAHDGGRTETEGDTLRYALYMQMRSYRGDDDPVVEKAADREATLAANVAKVIYLGLLGSLLVSAFLATLVVARDRGAPPDEPKRAS